MNWVPLAQNKVKSRGPLSKSMNPSGSMEGGTFLEKMRDYQLLKKHSVPLSELVAQNRGSWCIDYGLNSHSGGTRFESRMEHQLSWLGFFVVFHSPSWQIPGKYLN
jgi:hypothetical protein